MNKIFDFGSSFAVLDKISLAVKDPSDPLVLQLYFNHNIPTIVNCISEQERDAAYENIKKHFLEENND